MNLSRLKLLLFSRILPLLLAVFCFQKVQATHSAGSDISYRCLGGLTYEITVSFYRDCGGVAEPASITINCRSTAAGANLTLNAMKIPGYGNEITLPCSGNATNCNGGSGTGIREWKYRAVVTLPSAQSDWIFSYNICCRNCAITTIQSPCAATSVLYVEAKLNNLGSICNNSPSFTNVPVAYVCVGQTYHYNHGVVDQDGDSLVYSLITPKTSATTNVNFISPYNSSNPIASYTPFQLDAQTGDITFTPSQIQIGILAILIREYRNGELIGSVIRDMQVYTSVCNNTLPSISGINGSGNFTTTACPGQQICFDINAIDQDSAQSVTLTSNQSIQGATWQQTAGPHPVMHFCWTPTQADAGRKFSFTVRAQDNACPFNGAQVFSYHIKVLGRPAITTTGTQCFKPEGTINVQPSTDYNSYQWNNGATSSSLSSLQPGIYTVTITSGSGCTITDTAVIRNTGLLLLNGSANTTCMGECTGQISIQADGGTPPYSFNWSSGNNQSVLNNLCPGTYTVSASDINGCTADSAFQIISSAPVQFTLNQQDQVCNRAGSAEIIITGNSGGLKILWSNNDTTLSTSGLNAGNHWVKITDITGCDTTMHFVINLIQNQLTVHKDITQPSCYNFSNGMLNFNVQSGIPPYSYQLNNVNATSDNDSLPAGIYLIQITDAAGCGYRDTIELDNPSPLQINYTVNQTYCEKQNGSIDLDVTGGATPYFYNWSNGSQTAQIYNLTAGSYTVSVSDNNNCQISSVIQLAQVQKFNINAESASPTCTGESNGEATIDITDGFPPYVIQWNDGYTGAARNDLPAGNYIVTVTDSMLCTVVKSIKIDPAEPISYTINTQPASCINGIKGSAIIRATSQAKSINCIWPDSVNSLSRSNLSEGLYPVIIRNQSGCEIHDTIEISDYSIIQLNPESRVDICNGEKAQLKINKTDSAQYQWYFNGKLLNGANTNEFYTPAAGFYYVVVSSACGIDTSEIITVTVNKLQHISITSEQLICPGDHAELFVNGGVKYKWLPAEGLTDSISDHILVNPLHTTDYTVVITDEEGCTATATVRVTVICDNTEIPAGFSPNNDGTNDYFVITGIEKYPQNVVYIYNRWGNLVYKKKEYDNTWNGQGNVGGEFNGNDLTDGTYYYILDLKDNQPPQTGYVILRR